MQNSKAWSRGVVECMWVGPELWCGMRDVAVHVSSCLVPQPQISEDVAMAEATDLSPEDEANIAEVCCIPWGTKCECVVELLHASGFLR